MSTTSEEDDSIESFTFEEYINLIRYESNGNLSSVDLLTSDTSSQSACSSSQQHAPQGGTSPGSAARSKDNSSPSNIAQEEDGEYEVDERVDPVEREIASKRQINEEINEAELSSKEKLELADKIDPQLREITYPGVGCKERKKIRKKIRRKSLGTLTLIGNSVSADFSWTGMCWVGLFL